MSEGIKFDQQKIRYDLLSPEFLEETAKVLTFGATKYGDRNWELGMDWHRPFGALMRHLWAWWRGEEYDPESGLHHLSHAACNVQFLLTYALRNVGKDTRALPKAPSDTTMVTVTNEGYKQWLKEKNFYAKKETDLI